MSGRDGLRLREPVDGEAARVVGGALAAGWAVLAVLAATGPAESRGARLARPFAMALLLAPLVYRAFRHRRGAISAGRAQG